MVMDGLPKQLAHLDWKADSFRASDGKFIPFQTARIAEAQCSEYPVYQAWSVHVSVFARSIRFNWTVAIDGSITRGELWKGNPAVFAREFVTVRHIANQWISGATRNTVLSYRYYAWCNPIKTDGEYDTWAYLWTGGHGNGAAYGDGWDEFSSHDDMF